MAEFTGIPRQPVNSSGGVKRFYIADFADVKSVIDEATQVATITLADGEAITAENNPFAKYVCTKLSSNTTSTDTATSNTGQRGVEQVATLIFHKSEDSKRAEFEKWRNAELVVIEQDYNDDFSAIGCTNGADLITLVSSTGTAMQDLNGYTATITAPEANNPAGVDPALQAILTAM